jgi:hypothetical protein
MMTSCRRKRLLRSASHIAWLRTVRSSSGSRSVRLTTASAAAGVHVADALRTDVGKTYSAIASPFVSLFQLGTAGARRAFATQPRLKLDLASSQLA